MATSLEGLHRRAGGSLSVCLTWPGLPFALTPPPILWEETTKGSNFFFFLQTWGSGNLAPEILLSSCSSSNVQYNQWDSCRAEGCMQETGRGCLRVQACLFKWKKWKRRRWNLRFFWTELAGFPSAVNSNRRVCCWIHRLLEENSYWPFCWILLSLNCLLLLPGIQYISRISVTDYKKTKNPGTSRHLKPILLKWEMLMTFLKIPPYCAAKV